jgi:hypothetical protein
MKKTLLLACMIWIVWIGCSQKAQKPRIVGWTQNAADIALIRFKYPEGWVMAQEGSNRYTLYSSQEVIDRFYDYTVKGKDGARLVVTYDKMDTLKTLDQAINSLKNDLTSSGFDISEITAKQVQGVPGTRVHYSGFVDAKNKLEALQFMAVRDSFLCTVKFEAFNKFFPMYQMVFDTALATIRFPESTKGKSAEDLAKPSTVFATFDNQHLKIAYPENFTCETPQPKEPVVFSLEIRGYRQDSDVRIDILPAQKLTLDKVVEQNEKFYKDKMSSRGAATLDGVKSEYLNYSMVKGVQSRVYFMVKNDKIYRIIFNYYAAMKADFLPAFEKTVGSIAVK